MANIQNASTIKEIRTVAGLSLSEGFPQRLGDTVLPVVNVNPKDYRYTTVARENADGSTGNLTVYTTPSDKDFYLTGFVLTGSSDSTSDNLNTNLVATIEDGTALALADIIKQGLTADAQTITMTFPPLKLKRGSVITTGNGFTVGGSRKAATIYGFVVEPFENI